MAAVPRLKTSRRAGRRVAVPSRRVDRTTRRRLRCAPSTVTTAAPAPRSWPGTGSRRRRMETSAATTSAGADPPDRRPARRAAGPLAAPARHHRPYQCTCGPSRSTRNAMGRMPVPNALKQDGFLEGENAPPQPELSMADKGGLPRHRGLRPRPARPLGRAPRRPRPDRRRPCGPSSPR
ncbi:hypothetical protein HBB16_01330 [Pseudonocardia sp. MCCB 268]|nr:hypothetical protein [Pseudonocardia cytotoxica]